MNNNLLAKWEFSTDIDSTALIVPDGCRDLILQVTEGDRPRWFVSSLYDQSKSQSIQARSVMNGFRFKPGVGVKTESLLNSISNIYFDDDEVFNRIDDFTYRNYCVAEALEYLASGVKSVACAATEIGVSQRTLQRLLSRETNRSPIYWLMLARVRRAARALAEPIPLIEIADSFGYSDQAHMSREFKHWFNVSPSVLRQSPAILNQLNHLGYD
ncbi:MAG: AraC family transcriptional regulator [Colwellia sp.]|nr:AraC family transcriptional regulator [Colwellia sp.]